MESYEVFLIQNRKQPRELCSASRVIMAMFWGNDEHHVAGTQDRRAKPCDHSQVSSSLYKLPSI